MPKYLIEINTILFEKTKRVSMFFSLILAFGACTDKNSWNTYNNRDYKYTISYPDNYIIDTSSFKFFNRIDLLIKKEKGFKQNFSVTIYDTSFVNKDNRLKQTVREILDVISNAADKKEIIIGNNKGTKTVYETMFNFNMEQITAIKGKYMYVITYNIKKENDSERETIEKILKNFRFNEN